MERKTVSPEKQILAIAESILSPERYALLCEATLTWKDVAAACTYYGQRWGIPLHFLSDLNAIHEVEKKLTGAQFLVYAVELNKATKCFHHITPAVMACATAAQRAEAYLRTIGKWEDS